MPDHKREAQKTWGASPTGWTAAPKLAPGSSEFFQLARLNRETHEQPWLPDVIPFSASRGKRVLEVGFGPGYDAYTFLQNGAVYSGVDITPENVERTKKHLAPFGFEPDVHLGDAEALPFADRIFDLGVFEWSSAPRT